MCCRLVTHSPGLSPGKLTSPEGGPGPLLGGVGVMPHGRLVPAWLDHYCVAVECDAWSLQCPGGPYLVWHLSWVTSPCRGVSLGARFPEGPAQGECQLSSLLSSCLQRPRGAGVVKACACRLLWPALGDGWLLGSAPVITGWVLLTVLPSGLACDHLRGLT